MFARNIDALPVLYLFPEKISLKITELFIF